jgi:hypothetical protein
MVATLIDGSNSHRISNPVRVNLPIELKTKVADARFAEVEATNKKIVCMYKILNS